MPCMVNVSISQARFLKWPPCYHLRQPRSPSSFNLSGEIPQVAARLTGPASSGSMRFNLSGEIPQVAAIDGMGAGNDRHLCFNLSGEIPQVAARVRVLLPSSIFEFQSLRRDSSSGRTGRQTCRVTPTLFQSLRRDSSSGRSKERSFSWLLASFNLSGEIPQVAAIRTTPQPTP